MHTTLSRTRRLAAVPAAPGVPYPVLAAFAAGWWRETGLTPGSVAPWAPDIAALMEQASPEALGAFAGAAWQAAQFPCP